MVALCIIAAVAAITDIVVGILLIAQACGKFDFRQNYMNRINRLGD